MAREGKKCHEGCWGNRRKQDSRVSSMWVMWREYKINLWASQLMKFWLIQGFILKIHFSDISVHRPLLKSLLWSAPRSSFQTQKKHFLNNKTCFILYLYKLSGCFKRALFIKIKSIHKNSYLGIKSHIVSHEIKPKAVRILKIYASIL